MIRSFLNMGKNTREPKKEKKKFQDKSDERSLLLWLLEVSQKKERENKQKMKDEISEHTKKKKIEFCGTLFYYFYFSIFFLFFFYFFT